MQRLKIALVAMPWALADIPSAALGSLAAVLRRDRPDHQVDCHYAYLGVWDRIEDHYYVVSDSTIGELFYAGHLYPDQKAGIRECFCRWYTDSKKAGSVADGAEAYDFIERVTAEHLDELVGTLARRYDLVGFTATFSQLFASLAVINRLRDRDRRVCLVLGGATVAGEVGRSLLREYSAIDYLVQGEGEHVLPDLIDRLAADGHQATGTGSLIEAEPVTDLDCLPIPDYREYYQFAEDNSLFWYLPFEGSRGCWWNRVSKTGDPMQACYFCGLNSAPYRMKSEERVAAEIKSLCDTYKNVRVQFLDNVVRVDLVTSLAKSIRKLGKHFDFFMELRANIRPYQLLLLWEAGCRRAQVGVEGLSNSYLRRLGKGTKVIQNLQAMKTCFELGIISKSNLLTFFPGSTSDEVEETLRAIFDHAISFQPLKCSRFTVCHSSSVSCNPDAFGVSGIRNSSRYSGALPEAVNQRLVLPELDHDSCDPADWNAVSEACKAWEKRHEKIRRRWPLIPPMPLFYNDGVSFLEIVDRRTDFRVIELEGLWRQIYLYCQEIRSVNEVIRRFPEAADPSDGDDGDDVVSILAAFEGEKLLFRDGNRVLSLACAGSPQHAAKRIREAESER